MVDGSVGDSKVSPGPKGRPDSAKGEALGPAALSKRSPERAAPRLSRLALVLALIAICICFALAQQGDKPPIGKLKSDLGKLQSKQDALRGKLKKKKGEVRRARGDLKQIDAKLGQVEEALDNTTSRLESGQTRQKKLAGDLAQATGKMERTREQVRKRLKWMYTHEEQNLAQLFLKSRDLSDVASKAYLMKRIAKADRDLFDGYVSLRNDIADKKRRQDALVTEVAGLKRDQEATKTELAGVREDKASALSGLVKQQRDLERLVRQLDQEEAALAARIAAYNAGAGKTTGLRPFTGRFSRPVNGPMTSGFGMRFHPILKRRRMHAGVDFGAKQGTPIRASADGVVIAATYSQGYGNMVIIDHGGGISTLYGHCSRISVGGGQRVKRGDVVGAVGSTGLATGPHLHFEVRVNGRPVNPLGRL